MPLRQQRTVFQGRLLTVSLDTVELPNGAVREFEIIHHGGGAAVVAVDDNSRVCLLRQYRHAVDQWLWELPGGMLEEREDPLRAARRELTEEAGIVAKEWRPLGPVITSPGAFTETVHLYLATGLVRGAASPEAGEVFEVTWLPLDEAVGKALDGEISDAKTVIGLCRAQAARLRHALK
jgi:8-oxo-dGTP pyrophosphatase MutT (NUDIX family)